jgi:hypothetical protein
MQAKQIYLALLNSLLIATLLLALVNDWRHTVQSLERMNIEFPSEGCCPMHNRHRMKMRQP